MWVRASLFCRFTDTNGGSVKIMENSPQNIRGYTDIFTVYAMQQRRRYNS